MPNPLPKERLPEYIKRVLEETNNGFSVLNIVENYRKLNKDHIWPQ